MAGRKQYTEEFRQAVIEKVKSGATHRAAAEEVGIHPALVSQWLARANGRHRGKRVRHHDRPVKPSAPSPPSSIVSLSPTSPHAAVSEEALAFVAGQCHAWITIAAERLGVPSRPLTLRVGAILQRP